MSRGQWRAGEGRGQRELGEEVESYGLVKHGANGGVKEPSRTLII